MERALTSGGQPGNDIRLAGDLLLWYSQVSIRFSVDGQLGGCCCDPSSLGILQINIARVRCVAAVVLQIRSLIDDFAAICPGGLESHQQDIQSPVDRTRCGAPFSIAPIPGCACRITKTGGGNAAGMGGSLQVGVGLQMDSGRKDMVRTCAGGNFADIRPAICKATR